MVNVQKQRAKALNRFKNTHINNCVVKNLKFEKREVGDFLYEDIVLMDKVVGTFVYNKTAGQLTFEEPHVLPTA